MLEPIIDSHAHLFFPEFEGRVEDVLRRAAEAGLEAIINVGTRPETNPGTVEQTRRLNCLSATGCLQPVSERPQEHGLQATRGTRQEVHLPRLYAAVGFHPHEADLVQPDDWPQIERLAREPAVAGPDARTASWAGRPEVVALGEFGLDYHYERSSREGQRRVLRGGIELALRTGLPMIIHSRDAGLEVIETLDEVARSHGPAPGGALPRGVFHCFTDPWPVAEAALARGFFIGITGIVTYPTGENVRDVARRVPLARLLVETDAPFCTPEPVRTERRKVRRKGKDEPNEPAFVALVCEKLAELHGVAVDEVRRATTDNARALFGLT